MWDGRDAVNGQVVCPWGARDILSRLCRCWLGCAAGSPANCSPQFKEVHFSLLNTPTGLPAHALVFSWCQPSHLSLQHFPLVRVLWAQCWRHDSTFGTWGTQTSSSFASFYKYFWMQRNISSLESTSATNEQVFRVCLEQDPHVIVLFLYFPTSSTFAPCERWVIGLKTFGVFQCSWS